VVKHRLPAPLLLIVASVMWSFGGVLIKSVEWNAMGIAGTRSAFAALVIAAYFGWPRAGFSRVQWGAALAYAGTVIAFIFAVRWTTAANAIFLQYTAPMYVAALSHRLLGERPLRSDWALIGLALVGIALFFLDDLTLTGMWGIGTALFSGACFAAMILMLRRQREASPSTAILLGNLIAAVVALPWMLRGPFPSNTGWLALAALGIFQLGISYVFYTIAIRRVTAIEASVLPLLEPVLTPLWVMLLVGERPGGWALIGATLVLGAVLARALLSIFRAAQQRGAA
jgi:drug/metabolite transporter (DMT)-like permease